MGRHFKTTIITLVYTWLVVGCASHNVSIYDQNRIADIETWHISISAELEGIERSLNNVEERNLKSRIALFLKCDLQLRDNIILYLKSKHQTNVTKDRTTASGYIRIKALCYSDEYGKVDVHIHDDEKTLLAEVEINNGRHEFAKDKNEFAEYCAEIIAAVISTQ
jgi:hypothetical protein